MKIAKYEKTVALDSNLNDFMFFSLDYDENSRKVVSFCIIYWIYFQDFRFEVLKYDTSHGYLHVHQYWKEIVVKKKIDCEISAFSFEEMKKDIRLNWKNYRTLYLKKTISKR